MKWRTGNYKINLQSGTLKPVADYLKAQGRFRHLSDIEINRIQQKVNQEWAKLNQLAKM